MYLQKEINRKEFMSDRPREYPEHLISSTRPPLRKSMRRSTSTLSVICRVLWSRTRTAVDLRENVECAWWKKKKKTLQRKRSVYREQVIQFLLYRTWNTKLRNDDLSLQLFQYPVRDFLYCTCAVFLINLYLKKKKKFGYTLFLEISENLSSFPQR